MKRKKDNTESARAKEEEQPISARVIYREDEKRTDDLLIWLLRLSRSGEEL
jgi:hypothetical protein